jgi:stress response protein YsnF
MSNAEFVNNNARVGNLVEKLSSKLKNFQVMDRQGQLMGEIKDLILDDNRQINLVVSQVANDKESRQFLLMSKLVQKIDPPNKSVLVDVNKAEIEQLPEYVMTETRDMESSKMPNSSVTAADEVVADRSTTDVSNLNTSTSAVSAFADITPTSSSESADLQKQVDENSALKVSDTREVLEEEIIRLLGERVFVDRSKRKVGEVIVRKEIETRMVQVPVRREKLIVEQVSPERKQLAEIDLGQEEVTGIDMLENISPGSEVASLDNQLTVSGEFNSPKIASLLLNAIALERRHGCKKVRVEIVVEDAERQQTYQQWFNRLLG